MSIEKYWINRKPKEHNFILYQDAVLYRLKATKVNFSRIEDQVEHGHRSDQFIGLPISYLYSVEYREDDPNLRFTYNKDSTDEILISDAVIRKEIYDYLQEHTDTLKSEVKRPSVLRRIKKPLIALFVVMGIFAYVYSIIDGMSQGYEYEVRGRRGGAGLGGIILVLAELGLTTNLLIFTPLMFAALFGIQRNYKNDSEIHRLTYKNPT
ncbi:MAG: hypothetical protein AAF990_14840 [Bacteroidota bacterium]